MKKFLQNTCLAALPILGALLISNPILAQESMNCSLLYNWHDDELPASFAHNNTYNEIWGYELDGNEYAIIGSTMGTHIFDLTSGLEEEIFFIEGAVTGGQIVHRDYHTYQGYLYIVCDEGASTLQIVDLNNLPDEAPVVYDSNELIVRSHNIFIDEDAGILYRCGGNDQLSLFSLEDPVNPELIIDCDADIPDWSSTVGYLHDIFVRDGIAYCNNGNALYIVDFTTPESPVTLGSLTDYPDQGYNHSGWLHPNGEIYALADETHGAKVKILDVSDPTDIQVLALIGSDVHEWSIPHNLIFEGDLLHVSYYVDGYYVWDVADPENPELYAYYDTSEVPHSLGYKGAWGVYPFLSSGRVLVSDMQEGLFVFELGTAGNLNDQNEVALNGYPNPIAGDTFSIQLPSESTGMTRVLVFNETGQLINDKTIQISGNSRLELEAPTSAGFYTVKLVNDNFTGQTQLIKL